MPHGCAAGELRGLGPGWAGPEHSQGCGVEGHRLRAGGSQMGWGCMERKGMPGGVEGPGPLGWSLQPCRGGAGVGVTASCHGQVCGDSGQEHLEEPVGDFEEPQKQGAWAGGAGREFKDISKHGLPLDQHRGAALWFSPCGGKLPLGDRRDVSFF